jgi:equilibrative nucleoside transporter 1/2/3
MFLAAAPYFQSRFETSEWILRQFQSSILTVSTIAMLGSTLVLTNLQRRASYPRRIIASLILNSICFTLLAISTSVYRNVSVTGYFSFLMIMVFTTSVATGLCQNGVFAYVGGLGVGKYTQGIMTGQAVAGVLPCVVQIVAVLSVPERGEGAGAGQESPRSAMAYFLTATAVSAITLLAFSYLLRRHHGRSTAIPTTDHLDRDEEVEHEERKPVGLMTLFKKLRWLAMGVFVCFAVTMVFPVFTAEIESVRSGSSSSRLFSHVCFIPFAFLVWNTGDLIGRLLPLIPMFAIFHYPRATFLFSLSRIVFIPLYLLCNIRGEGAIIPSDTFYLLFVQFFFGVTNGFVGASCMIGASEQVEATEREAAGGFMGLMLVGGLATGSLLSFIVAKA